jgi:hypothetical protein
LKKYTETSPHSESLHALSQRGVRHSVYRVTAKISNIRIKTRKNHVTQLSEVVARLPVNAKAATVPGSTPASVNPVKFEGRQIKHAAIVLNRKMKTFSNKEYDSVLDICLNIHI